MNFEKMNEQLIANRVMRSTVSKGLLRGSPTLHRIGCMDGVKTPLNTRRITGSCTGVCKL